MDKTSDNCYQDESDGIVVSSDDELIAGLSEAVGDHIQQEEKKHTTPNNQVKTGGPASNSINSMSKPVNNNAPLPHVDLTVPADPRGFSYSKRNIPQLAVRFTSARYDDYYKTMKYDNMNSHPYQVPPVGAYPHRQNPYTNVDPRKFPGAQLFGDNYKPRAYLSSYQPGREHFSEHTRPEEASKRLTGTTIQKELIAPLPLHATRSRSYEGPLVMPPAPTSRDPRLEKLSSLLLAKKHPLDPFSIGDDSKPTKKREDRWLHDKFEAQQQHSLDSSRRHPLDPLSVGKSKPAKKSEEKLWLHDRYSEPEKPKSANKVESAKAKEVPRSEPPQLPPSKKEKRKRKRNKKDKETYPVPDMPADVPDPKPNNDGDGEQPHGSQEQPSDEIINSQNASIESSEPELVIVEEITEDESILQPDENNQPPQVQEDEPAAQPQKKKMNSEELDVVNIKHNLEIRLKDTDITMSTTPERIVVLEEEVLSSTNDVSEEAEDKNSEEQSGFKKRKVTLKRLPLPLPQEDSDIIIEEDEIEEGEIPEEDELLTLRLEALNSTAKNLDNKAIRADLEEWVSEDLDMVQDQKNNNKGQGSSKMKKSPGETKKMRRTRKIKNLLRKFKSSKAKTRTPKPLTLGAEILRNQLSDENKREQRALETALKKVRRMPSHEKSVDMFMKLMDGKSPSEVMKDKTKKKERSRSDITNGDNYEPVEMEVDSSSDSDDIEEIRPPGTEDVVAESRLVFPPTPAIQPFVSPNILTASSSNDEQPPEPPLRRKSEDYDEDSLREILLKQLIDKRKVVVKQTATEKPVSPPIPTKTTTTNIQKTSVIAKTNEPALKKTVVVPPAATKTKQLDPRLYRKENSPTNINANKRKVNNVNVTKIVPHKKQRVHTRSPAHFPRHQPVVITISDSSDDESISKKSKNVDMTPSKIMQSSVNNLIEEMRLKATKGPNASIYKGLEEKVAQLRAKMPNKKNEEAVTSTKKVWPFGSDPKVPSTSTESWPFSKDNNTDSQNELETSNENMREENNNEVAKTDNLNKVNPVATSISLTVTSLTQSITKPLPVALPSVDKPLSTIVQPISSIIKSSTTTRPLSSVANPSSSAVAILPLPSGVAKRKQPTAKPIKSTKTSGLLAADVIPHSGVPVNVPLPSSKLTPAKTNVVKSPTATISVMASKITDTKSVSITLPGKRIKRRRRSLGVAKKSKAIKKGNKSTQKPKGKKGMAAVFTQLTAADSPSRNPLNSSVVAVDNDLESIRKTISLHTEQMRSVNQDIKSKMEEIQTLAVIISEATKQNAALMKEAQRIKRMRKELQYKIHEHKKLHSKALKQNAKKFESKRQLMKKIRGMREEYQLLLKQREKTYVESRNTPEKSLNKKKLIETKNTLVEQQQQLQKKINELKNQSNTKLIRVNNATKKSRRRYSLSDTVTKQLEKHMIKQEKPDSEIFGLSKIEIGKQSPVKGRLEPKDTEKIANKENSTTSKSVKPKIARKESAEKTVKADEMKFEMDASFTIRPIEKKPVKKEKIKSITDKEQYRKLVTNKLSAATHYDVPPQLNPSDKKPCIAYQAYFNSSYFYNYILHPLSSDQPIYSSSESDREISTTNEESYQSCLIHYRSYRLSPFYRRMSQLTISSKTFSHKINPHKVFCRYDLTGVCKDPTCHNQHTSNITLSRDEMLLDLLAYQPDLLGITEENQKSFSQERLLEIAKKKAQDLCGVSEDMVSPEEYYVLLISKINKELGRNKVRGYCTLPPRIIRPEQMTPDLSDFTDSEEVKDLKPPAVIDPDELVEFEERYCAVVERNRDVIKNIVAESPNNVHKWLQVSKRRLQGIRNNDSEAVKKKKMELVLHNLSLALEHNPLSEDIWCFYLSVLKQRVEVNPRDQAAQTDFNEMLNEAVSILPLSMRIWKECFHSSKSLKRIEFFYQQLLMNLLSRKSNESASLYSHWLLTTLLSYTQLLLDVGKYQIALSLLEAHSRNISLKYQNPSRDKCPMLCSDLIRLWLCYIHLVEFMYLPDDVTQHSSQESGLQSEVSIVIRVPKSTIEVLPDCEIVLPFTCQHKMNKSSLTMQNLFRDAVSKCSRDSLSLAENTRNCLDLYFSLMKMCKATKDYDHAINLSNYLLGTFSNPPEDASKETYHHEIMLLQDLCVELMLECEKPSVEITQTFDRLITDEPWNAQLCIRASDYQIKQVKPADHDAAMMYYETTLAAYFQFEAQSEMSLEDLIIHYRYLFEQTGTTRVLLRPNISSDLEQQKPYLWICYCNLLHMKSSLKQSKSKKQISDTDFLYKVIEDAIEKLTDQKHKDVLWKRYIDHCVDTLTVTSCKRVDYYTRLLTSGIRVYLTATPTKHLFENQYEFWNYNRHNKMIFYFLSLLDCKLHTQLLHMFTNVFPHNLKFLIRSCQYFASNKEYSTIPSVTWPAITSENCFNVSLWKMLFDSYCKQENFLLALQTVEKSVETFVHNKELWREYLGLLRAFGSSEDLDRAKSACLVQVDVDPESLLADAVMSDEDT